MKYILKNLNFSENPRWKQLDKVDACTLAGYYYALYNKEEYNDSIFNKIDTKRDFLFAMFAAGAEKEDLLTITKDFVGSILEINVLNLEPKYYEDFAINLQEALMLITIFSIEEEKQHLFDIIEIFLNTWKQKRNNVRIYLLICYQILRNKLIPIELFDMIIQKHKPDAFEDPLNVGLIQKDGKILLENIAKILSDILYKTNQPYLKNKVLFQGRIVYFREFGQGLIFTGYIGLGQILGCDLPIQDYIGQDMNTFFDI